MLTTTPRILLAAFLLSLVLTGDATASGSVGMTTQQLQTAAPQPINLSGVAAAEGASLGVARASHVHSLTGVLPVANGGTGAATAANNTVFAGPNGGGPLAPTFRALVANDIPNLSTAKTTTGTWADAFLASAYSGIGSCGANTAVTALTRNSAPTCTQPAFSWLTGTATAAQIPNLDGAKINTGNLGRPVSLNAGETVLTADSLAFNLLAAGAGIDFGLTHPGLSLHAFGSPIHIDSSFVGVVFDDFIASSGLLSVTAGVLGVSTAPQTYDQSFGAYVPAGIAAATSVAQRPVLNNSTFTAASNYATVVAGSGAGNYVMKLCTGGATCAAPSTYLTCTISCAAAAGTITACTVTKSAITGGSTFTWSVATACATTSPAGNVTAYATTP